MILISAPRVTAPKAAPKRIERRPETKDGPADGSHCRRDSQETQVIPKGPVRDRLLRDDRQAVNPISQQGLAAKRTGTSAKGLAHAQAGVAASGVAVAGPV